ncbi:MAG: glycosyltransferase family 4 protein [Lachnospiraceae bacterium]|nr:glycosyltransferase family 4 protein [Lachnospiraceae bacterium]
MKILLFGTGDYYNRYKKWFEHQEVLALLDNSVQKQHTAIDALKVLPPEEGIRLNYDIIVILSFYVKQMKQQLISLGVDQNKIYHFYDLHQLFGTDRIKRPVQYFLNAEETAKCRKNGMPKVLLLSNDLALGGPSIALFHAAKVLIKQGYTVVYASMLDGPLKQQLIENDIPVIIDENLQIATMQETDWVSAFSLIICNTLNFHVFLSERDTKIPVIWWLHDAAFFYEGVNENVIGKISLSNLKAVSVGPVPAAAVRKFLPGMECGELLYGVADFSQKDECGQGRTAGSDKVRFITIGFLEPRKGQDILLQAIRKLPDHIRRSSEFYIVGHNATLFGEQICSEIPDTDGIVVTGSVGRETLHELLRSSDVLICPSRQDPMPTVAAEAMMHSVPCIVSDATGTAAYIHDGEEGFIFPSEDVQALADRIEWCVTNEEELESMGKKARKLYEKHFSMPAFVKSFMEVVHEALSK